MAKKKVVKKTKKKVVKDIKVAEPVIVKTKVKDKGVPQQVVLENQVCYVDYVPPKRPSYDKRVHFNPNDLKKKITPGNPFE
jgi:hypothetical protein|tara:strand:+ start:254 stop:496 length:243 start_codon:yes stop_codon:yes gene_type:complete